MLDLLRDYLDKVTSPEEKHVIELADKALVRMEVDHYESSIEEILMLDDEVDNGATLEAIQTLYRSLVYQILVQHSVFFTEDTSLEMLANIALGLLDLDDHEEKKQLIATTRDDATINERFCELMKMVTKYEVEELLPHVVDVSPSFLARMREDDEDTDFEDDETILNRQKRIAVLRAYDVYLPDGLPAILTGLLRAGVDVGLPFKLYAGLLEGRAEQMIASEIAEVFFGMALISSDGADQPIDVVKEHIEEYISNADTITTVMADVNRLMAGFQP